MNYIKYVRQFRQLKYLWYMLAKFLKFAKHVESDSNLKLTVTYDPRAAKENRLLDCECKRKFLGIEIETDYMKFTGQIDICCRAQYKFMMENLCTQTQNLSICCPRHEKADKLLLLNDREWNTIEIQGDGRNEMMKCLSEYLPKTKKLYWEDYEYKESLQSAFYLLQENIHMAYVSFRVMNFELFKEHLSSIGIEVPLNDRGITEYVIYIDKNTINITKYSYDDEQENHVCAVPYDYEDLNL